MTRTSLAYYDGDEESKKKEKGRIFIRDIKLVENVRIEDRPQSFQVRYFSTLQKVNNENRNNQRFTMSEIKKGNIIHGKSRKKGNVIHGKSRIKEC